MMCLPVGLVLQGAKALFSAGLPSLVPWLLVLIGMPSAIIELVAALRTGEIVFDRRKPQAVEGDGKS
jgi:hypothetical protein